MFKLGFKCVISNAFGTSEPQKGNPNERSDFANCFSQTSRNKNLRFHNSLNDFCKLAKVITWGKTFGVVGVEDAVLENIVENGLDQAANG